MERMVCCNVPLVTDLATGSSPKVSYGNRMQRQTNMNEDAAGIHITTESSFGDLNSKVVQTRRRCFVVEVCLE